MAGEFVGGQAQVYTSDQEVIIKDAFGKDVYRAIVTGPSPRKLPSTVYQMPTIPQPMQPHATNAGPTPPTLPSPPTIQATRPTPTYQSARTPTPQAGIPARGSMPPSLPEKPKREAASLPLEQPKKAIVPAVASVPSSGEVKKFYMQWPEKNPEGSGWEEVGGKLRRFDSQTCRDEEVEKPLQTKLFLAESQDKVAHAQPVYQRLGSCPPGFEELRVSESVKKTSKF